METIAYLRVSTEEQDLEKFKADILKYANDKQLGNVQFIEEKVTGTKNWKERELGTIIGVLNAGDNIIVPELSRLARSISQILNIIEECKSKKITLYSIKEGFSTLDKSIQSTITSTIFGLVAQIERELISQRTKEALQSKKAQGITLGRPIGSGKSKLDIHKEEIEGLLLMGVTKTRIAEKYNTNIQNLRHWMSKNGIKTPDKK